MKAEELTTVGAKLDKAWDGDKEGSTVGEFGSDWLGETEGTVVGAMLDTDWDGDKDGSIVGVMLDGDKECSIVGVKLDGDWDGDTEGSEQEGYLCGSNTFFLRKICI